MDGGRSLFPSDDGPVGMRYIQFDPVDYAKTALVPLADELIACADAAGSAEQQLYFGKIRWGWRRLPMRAI